MKTFFSNVVSVAHNLFREFLSPGDIVVDATCGNGKDILVMAKLLKGKGKIIGYDVQKEALAKSMMAFEALLSREEASIISLKHSSHVCLEENGAKLFHYNLGYLPGGDHDITTLTEDTIASLNKALDLLHSEGIITVICYPGHEEGKRERDAVESFAEALDPGRWTVVLRKMMNRNLAPELFVFKRNLL
ncbi:class I SAM-dependent methyltransferase [Chlamydiifrater phoenicopteri]|uniref:class I SAM-dependent methyltransferase n=1 Tax=Chlamydiifrater phoenicopteri TaxID=2681469 RepID=UPI001BCC09F2|nr:class I SAM-dependent methyltransferase [Chlamydiifrater phoenicopteri]